MQVLLICHYFRPESGAPQARLSELAQRWRERGVAVQVLTGFPNHPSGIIADEYAGHRVLEETVEGIPVTRTWLYATPNEGVVKKTLSHISFMASAVALGWRRVRRPDVVVVSSPTFFSILPALVYARRFRVPLVIEVRDLWPGIFVELGVLTNRFVIRALERIELAAYRAASLVVVVSEGFRDDLVGRGVPTDKVEVIYNGVDTERFAPRPVDHGIRGELGVAPDERLVLYAGALGISHALETVIEAGGILRERHPELHAQIRLVGAGARGEALAAAAAGIDGVEVVDPVPPDRMPALLNSADVLVVSLRDVPMFETFIPSKMFEYLATATPVVGALAGEAASILRDAGATVVPPESPLELAEAVALQFDRPDAAEAAARQGRRFVIDRFERRDLADRYLEHLADVVGDARSDHQR